MRWGHKIVLKVDVPADHPRCRSVEAVWKTANWHEREAFDLYGIVFEGHPDLRRILLPDDWEGYPLRKDYQVPEYYNGMKVPY
jgi:NADH-quinone oxidoreductase subunit C